MALSNDLPERIREAFGSSMLRKKIEITDREMRDCLTFVNGRCWDEIEPEEVVESFDCLTFLHHDYLITYLPAWLTAAALFPDENVSTWTSYSLERDYRMLSVTCDLDQIMVITDLLGFLLDKDPSDSQVRRTYRKWRALRERRIAAADKFISEYKRRVGLE